MSHIDPCLLLVAGVRLTRGVRYAAPTPYQPPAAHLA
jgi:hypothetical protein